jgi:SAM-dependent methyltransferase
LRRNAWLIVTLCLWTAFLSAQSSRVAPDDPKLPAGQMDLIFVISSYHHFDDPVALMRKARTALKPTGRLAIAEWIPTKDNGGTGTPPEKMRAQMDEAGFILERVDGSLEANGLNIYLFRPGAR